MDNRAIKFNYDFYKSANKENIEVFYVDSHGKHFKVSKIIENNSSSEYWISNYPLFAFLELENGGTRVISLTIDGRIDKELNNDKNRLYICMSENKSVNLLENLKEYDKDTDIIIKKNRSNNYKVIQGDKSSDELGWDEMLGLVATLTMSDKRPCLHWMRNEKNTF